MRFWASAALELRHSDDVPMIEQAAKSVGIEEQLLLARQQGTAEAPKVFVLQVETAGDRPCLTGIFIRDGCPFLIQLEASKLSRREALQYYNAYFAACRNLIEGKQAPAAAI